MYYLPIFSGGGNQIYIHYNFDVFYRLTDEYEFKNFLTGHVILENSKDRFLNCGAIWCQMTR